MKPEDWVEVEAIKQLKARYFRLLDAKDWASWGELFTDDCRMRVEVGDGRPDQEVEGRDAIVEAVSRALEGSTTVHHGHMPEIELTGDASARGIWSMFDKVDWGTRALTGYGHYAESYEKRGGRWHIATFRLTRLRVDRTGDWGDSR